MKDKKFQCVLYEESQKDIIENLKNNYICAYICHDKDVDLQGNLIKPHYHFVVQLDKEIRFTTLAKNLNVSINVIEKLKSINDGLLYLIHATPSSLNKYQYSIDEVGGALKEKLLSLINKTDNESIYILKILNILEENKNKNFSFIVKLIVEQGLWSYFRRGASIFRQVYYENTCNNSYVDLYSRYRK